MVSFKSDHLYFEIFEIDNFRLSNFRKDTGQLALYFMEIVLKKFPESKNNKAMKNTDIWNVGKMFSHFFTIL